MNILKSSTLLAAEGTHWVVMGGANASLRLISKLTVMNEYHLQSIINSLPIELQTDVRIGAELGEYCVLGVDIDPGSVTYTVQSREVQSQMSKIANYLEALGHKTEFIYATPATPWLLKIWPKS